MQLQICDAVQGAGAFLRSAQFQEFFWVILLPNTSLDFGEIRKVGRSLRNNFQVRRDRQESSKAFGWTDMADVCR
jgi:hypothetical protein